MGYSFKKAQRGSAGKRADLGFFVRSRWEANVVRMFRYLKFEFAYEKKEFEFPEKRGNRFYVPDFYLPTEDRYVEIKGFLDKDSKTKLRRMMKYYPEIASRMILIIDRVFTKKGNMTKEAGELMKIGFKPNQFQSYTKINRSFSFLPNWE